MAEPKKRDTVERPAFIPEAEFKKRAKAKKRKGRAAAAKPPSPETRRWMEVVASELFSARVAVSPRPAESDPESAPQSVSSFPGKCPGI